MTPVTPAASAAPQSVGGLTVLELFCGIGGLAAALEGSGGRILEAVDINDQALRVVTRNFAHPVNVRNLEFVTPSDLSDLGADLWWMSSPCQPFTRRGKQRDDEDPRSRAFLHLVQALTLVRPRHLALENVPEFQTSRCRELLIAALTDQGYERREQLLCSTAFGIPNRRLRYYLLASRDGLLPQAPEPFCASPRRPLQAFLDPEPCERLALDPATLAKYRPALHIVEQGDPFAVTRCFTSSYGRSPVRSGSYLATCSGARRFSPEEILRLLGFPPSFVFPDALPRSSRWRLAGNSLSIPAVRHVLAGLPSLSEAGILDRI